MLDPDPQQATAWHLSWSNVVWVWSGENSENTAVAPQPADRYEGKQEYHYPLSLVQIHPDTELWLVEPYFAKVYAITTHLKESTIPPTRGILCLSVCCYGMISVSISHTWKGSTMILYLNLWPRVDHSVLSYAVYIVDTTGWCWLGWTSNKWFFLFNQQESLDLHWFRA